MAASRACPAGPQVSATWLAREAAPNLHRLRTGTIMPWRLEPLRSLKPAGAAALDMWLRHFRLGTEARVAIDGSVESPSMCNGADQACDMQCYSPVYEETLSPWRATIRSVLVIGVCRGESLAAAEGLALRAPAQLGAL